MSSPRPCPRPYDWRFLVETSDEGTKTSNEEYELELSWLSKNHSVKHSSRNLLNKCL